MVTPLTFPSFRPKNVGSFDAQEAFPAMSIHEETLFPNNLLRDTGRNDCRIVDGRWQLSTENTSP